MYDFQNTKEYDDRIYIFDEKFFVSLFKGPLFSKVSLSICWV